MKERLLLKTRTMPQEEKKSTKQDDSKIIIKAMVLIAVTTQKENKFLLWLNLKMFMTFCPQVTTITKKLIKADKPLPL